MFGQLSFAVSDLERAIPFYDPTLVPLGLTWGWTTPKAAGYGYPGGGDLSALKKQPSSIRPPGPGFGFQCRNPSCCGLCRLCDRSRRVFDRNRLPAEKHLSHRSYDDPEIALFALHMLG
jgi:hypothetical protein